MLFRSIPLAIAIALTSYSLQAVEPKSEAELAKARAELQAARDELHTLTKRIAELSMQLGKNSPEAFAFRYLHDPDRAMIGIVMAPGTQKDIRINAVTPGGPAAKAGIRAGDILMSVNGKSLYSTAGATDDSNVETARTLLKELKEGEKVKLIVQRDNKPLTFEVKAERRESWDWAGVLGNLPEMETALAGIHGPLHDRNIKMIINGKEKLFDSKDSHGKVRHFEHDRHSPHHQRFEHIIHKAMNGLPWNAFNLSTLNAGLGHYFGTDHGVLVLDTNDTSLKELKAGDVIQIIDGKPADSVSDVMRAIAAKEPGQPMQVEIWRDGKRQVIATTAPDRDQFMFPAPPTPPAPPAPPQPEAPAKMSAPLPPPAPPPELTSVRGVSV